MNKLERVLNWLNLINQDGKLSLTSATLYAMLIKVVLIPQIGLADCVVLGLALLNYGYKRYLVSKEPKVAELTAKAEEEIATLRDDVNKIKLARGIGARSA